MSERQSHFLDLKLPIGWLLSGCGVLLAVYGLVTRPEMYERSLGYNVNLIWGVLMIAIGGAFLLTFFLKKARAAAREAAAPAGADAKKAAATD